MDEFMQAVEILHPDLIANAQEWCEEGWGLTMKPTPEQIAAALLMEANTQDECVKTGDSSPDFPDRLRRVAYSIINHYHERDN